MDATEIYFKLSNLSISDAIICLGALIDYVYDNTNNSYQNCIDNVLCLLTEATGNSYALEHLIHMSKRDFIKIIDPSIWKMILEL